VSRARQRRRRLSLLDCAQPLCYKRVSAMSTSPRTHSLAPAAAARRPHPCVRYARPTYLAWRFI